MLEKIVCFSELMFELLIYNSILKKLLDYKSVLLQKEQLLKN